MKQIFFAIVAFLALAVMSCEPKQAEVIDIAGLEPDYHSYFDSAYMAEQKVIEKRKKNGTNAKKPNRRKKSI
jgi:hypothetical protein